MDITAGAATAQTLPEGLLCHSQLQVNALRSSDLFRPKFVILGSGLQESQRSHCCELTLSDGSYPLYANNMVWLWVYLEQKFDVYRSLLDFCCWRD